jgi:osmotically-inducible protein OsmY
MENRKWFRSVILIGALAIAAGLPHTAAARGAQNEELKKMTQEVVNTIANLPDYTVYDWLTFSIADGVVTLTGFAHTTRLRGGAPKAVEKVEGVKEVKNEIEYTRGPKTDEKVRRELYRAIYTTYLQSYGKEAMYFGARAQTALPRGPHPIHILVLKGDVTLRGYVHSEEDKQEATKAVNSVGGMVKSLKNELVVKPKQSE